MKRNVFPKVELKEYFLSKYKIRSNVDKTSFQNPAVGRLGPQKLNS